MAAYLCVSVVGHGHTSSSEFLGIMTKIPGPANASGGQSVCFKHYKKAAELNKSQSGGKSQQERRGGGDGQLQE